MNEMDVNRARTLGNLIHDARLRAGRGAADCAQALGLDDDDFARVEAGDQILSLPELETLALYLNIPMAYFWGNDRGQDESDIDFAAYRTLRQAIIAVLLRQARIQARLSTMELANATGIEESQVEAYEEAQAAIPYFDLERLTRALDVPTDYFTAEEHGPLARREVGQRLHRGFDKMPAEMQAFLAEPINRSYLETAMRLSELDVGRLRAIAESLLEITY
jgi:transcriptional regulator with XRE-family HTH domain